MEQGRSGAFGRIDGAGLTHSTPVNSTVSRTIRHFKGARRLMRTDLRVSTVEFGAIRLARTIVDVTVNRKLSRRFAEIETHSTPREPRLDQRIDRYFGSIDTPPFLWPNCDIGFANKAARTAERISSLSRAHDLQPSGRKESAMRMETRSANSRTHPLWNFDDRLRSPDEAARFATTTSNHALPQSESRT